MRSGTWVDPQKLGSLGEEVVRPLEISAPLGQTTLTTEPQVLPALTEQVKERKELALDMLSDITAVDGLHLGWPKRFVLVYHFYSLIHHHRLRVKVFLGEDAARAPSLTPYYRSANWLEREVYDMFGIEFEGHPDLRRILLYPEFKGHPLRKDYPVDLEQPLLPLREIGG